MASETTAARGSSPREGSAAMTSSRPRDGTPRKTKSYAPARRRRARCAARAAARPPAGRRVLARRASSARPAPAVRVCSVVRRPPRASSTATAVPNEPAPTTTARRGVERAGMCGRERSAIAVRVRAAARLTTAARASALARGLELLERRPASCDASAGRGSAARRARARRSPTIAWQGTPAWRARGRDLAGDLALQRLLVEPALADDDARARRACAVVEAERARARTRAPGSSVGAVARPQPARQAAGGAGHRHAARVARAASPRARSSRCARRFTAAGSAPFCGPNDLRRALERRAHVAQHDERRAAQAAARPRSPRSRPRRRRSSRCRRRRRARPRRRRRPRRRSARRCPRVDAASASRSLVGARAPGRWPARPRRSRCRRPRSARSPPWTSRPSGSLTRRRRGLAAERREQHLHRPLAAVGDRAQVGRRRSPRAPARGRSRPRPRSPRSVPLNESGATSTGARRDGSCGGAARCAILPADGQGRDDGRGGGHRGPRHEPRQGLLPRTTGARRSRSSTSSSTTSTVADAVLLGLRERPTVLKRWNDGITGDFFFQKRVPEKRRRRGCRPRPCTSRRAAARPSSCPNDAAHLVWAANLGNIDWNPWPVRRADLDHPDELRDRPRPAAGRRLGDGARGRDDASSEVLDEHGHARLPEDERLARDPRLRAHRAALGLHRGAPRGARAGARGRAPDARARRRRSGGRRSATASSSTTTRTRATAPSPAPTPCARCPTRACRCGLRWDEVPDVETGGPAARHRARSGCATIGDPLADDRRRRARPRRRCSTSRAATRRRASATRRGRRTSPSSPASPSACSRAARARTRTPGRSPRAARGTRAAPASVRALTAGQVISVR